MLGFRKEIGISGISVGGGGREGVVIHTFPPLRVLKEEQFLLILPEGYLQKKNVKGGSPAHYLECWGCLWVYAYQPLDFSHLLKLPEEHGGK